MAAVWLLMAAVVFGCFWQLQLVDCVCWLWCLAGCDSGKAFWLLVAAVTMLFGCIGSCLVACGSSSWLWLGCLFGCLGKGGCLLIVVVAAATDFLWQQLLVFCGGSNSFQFVMVAATAVSLVYDGNSSLVIVVAMAVGW